MPFVSVSFCVGGEQDKKVFSLDLGLLLAGTKERGELEKRVNTVISEAQNAGEELKGVEMVL